MAKDNQRFVLFVNGELNSPENLRTQLRLEDTLIAVDGGLRHLTALGLTPDLILGDLDSANPAEVAKLEAQGVPVRRYPPEKDETDLELAINTALEQGASIIWIAAALGNRLDHTLGNLYLLTQSRLAEIDVRLVDGDQEVFLIRDETTITGQPGQIVSLIPLMGPVPGVVTAKLAYPLRHETLYPDKTRGISNVMTADTATVTIDNGILLCIHSFNATH